MLYQEEESKVSKDMLSPWSVLSPGGSLVLEAPSLESFKVRLDGSLINLI